MLYSVIFESKNVRDEHVIGYSTGLKKVIYFKNINTFKYFKVAFVSEATLVRQVLNSTSTDSFYNAFLLSKEFAKPARTTGKESN